MAECGKPATVYLQWAGKELYQCEEHAKQCAAVGRAIGYPVPLHLYNGSKLCSQRMPPEER